jgi:eukaryotic-like serine/threonine-protein kinase
MSLSTGSHVGPYELVALIGAGGMGEVYRARDLRLGREVAVKVLPPSFSVDPERLRRFEQEARAVASLSHPNILAVHDIGRYENQPFMVSELLEGESLREILTRGALPQRKAIDYAVQIAHGLAAAHGKDIAHRDLKPDNIFITREGRIKILDFGLAKTLQRPSATGVDDGLTAMTELAPPTDAGTVMGTVGYMSPEQVRGAGVDCRTDIFSFGAVLYEMLSGVRAFKRNTAAETMTAILNDDPPELSLAGHPIAPALERTVRHCLEKSPEQRFQSARDLAFDLESFSTLTPAVGSAASATGAGKRWWYALAAAALLTAAALAVWKMTSRSRTPAGSQFRQVTYRRSTLDDARFTPDHQNILYTAALEASEPEIYTVGAKAIGGHPLGIRNARLLAVSTRGELAVALAPQRLSILLSPGNLARTMGDNGAPKPEIENVQAADFTPDGSALAIVRWIPSERMCQMEYPIGKVLHRNRAINDIRFSPSGKYLAFITHDNFSDDRGTVIIVRSTGEKVIESPMFESAQGLSWSPSGEEVWVTSPLESGDLHAFTLSGKSRIPLTVPGRLRLMDIGTDGELLVAQGVARRGIVVSSRNGETRRDLSWLDFSYGRAVSGNGKMILFEEEGSERQGDTVFVRNVDGSPAVPLGEGYGLALSPDNNWALGQKLTQPTPEIWLLPVGPGQPRRISPPNLAPLGAASFLSDGKRILYIAREAGHGPRTWLQDVSNDLSNTNPRPITKEGTVGLRISPDDKWLVAGRLGVRLTDLVLVPIAGGDPQKILGLKPDDAFRGWTADGQLYVELAADAPHTAYQLEKLNPHTGARTEWRKLEKPTIAGISPETLVISPDGANYFYNYSLRIFDLYTVSGVR